MIKRTSEVFAISNEPGTITLREYASMEYFNGKMNFMGKRMYLDEDKKSIWKISLHVYRNRRTILF